MSKQTRAKWSKSETDLFYRGLRQFGSDFAMIQQLFPDKTRHHVRQKFKSEEKKNPMLIHDAIVHRLGDNLYFKMVIKQLNIEDVIPDISSTRKQDLEMRMHRIISSMTKKIVQISWMTNKTCICQMCKKRMFLETPMMNLVLFLIGTRIYGNTLLEL